MPTISSFRSIGTKHDVYKGKDCVEKFCKSLKTHAMKRINSKIEKSQIISQRAARIIWKYKNLLYL